MCELIDRPFILFNLFLGSCAHVEVVLLSSFLFFALSVPEGHAFCLSLLYWVCICS
jgi:hypothetical protein